jgi:flagellar basal body-associated protein FliL
MSDTEPTKAQEVPLEDIDRLLQEEDPEFARSLEEVRNVEIDQSVEIEATVPDDDALSPDDGFAAPEKGRWRARIRGAWVALRLGVKSRIAAAFRATLIFLKTRPKEFVFYALGLSRALAKKAMTPLTAFRNADRKQKLLSIVLVAVAAASLWILLSNFKGVWLPALNEPILRSLETRADSVFTYDPGDPGESFYAAFPQERYEFLFQKMKVNLRRTADNPLPMGAFEVMVVLDSKDTAIEVRDREVEFYDLLSRVFEDQTFASLATERGKGRLKAEMKRELDQKLTQGWVKEIDFKTFILKP